jgi:acyl dehydratase
MHKWSEISGGTAIGPSQLDLSPAANERYWRAAGLDHPLLLAGAAYPLIAANCTVLAWLATCPEPMIQTRQHLICHRTATSPLTLRTTGIVETRHTRRGRDYVTIRVEIVESAGRPIWTSEVDFTPVATATPGAASPRPRRSAESADEPQPGGLQPVDGTPLVHRRREMTVTDDLIRQYSRRGNYHSEAATAEDLGLPGLVAQGTQVCGPAFGVLLDHWGEDFLATGSFDARFLAMVLGGDTVEAEVAIHAREATFTVHNRTRNRVAAIGRAASGSA